MEDEYLQVVEHALLLMQEEKKKEAQLLLAAFLKQNPQSAPAWWILSQTLDDVEQERDCLERVLRFDPGYEQARTRLGQLMLNHEQDMTAPVEESIPYPPQADFPPEQPPAFAEEYDSLRGEQFDLFAPDAFDQYNRGVDSKYQESEQTRFSPPREVADRFEKEEGAAVQGKKEEVPSWIQTDEIADLRESQQPKRPRGKERMSVLEILLLIILIALVIIVAGYLGLSWLEVF